ncbi:MAG: acyl-protein synthetase [Nitrospirae bacterium]|nr:MAG: acyl-protein synthetase [Nitrospirota bacterium]
MAYYSTNSDFVKKLDRDVLEFVNKGFEGRDEEQFNRLALREFELLYNTAEVYRGYCKTKNLSPETITRWDEIPAVSSFALRKLSSKDKKYCGVIELAKKRRPIYPDKSAVELISSTNALMAKRFLFPDTEKIKMLFLAPPPEMAKGMVMASGLKELEKRFGAADSEFIISFSGLKLKRLLRALKSTEKTRQPVALMGASMVIDYFFDACKKEGIRFRLPEGSRMCESGGYMGRYTKCPKDEFIKKCGEVLGIEEDFCLNAFWVCESSTVYFDNALRNLFAGIKEERYKQVPPWSRVVVVDAHNFQRLPKGEPGLIRHYDITNRAFSFAVQTDKTGYETEKGFDVEGKSDKDIPSHPGGRFVTKVMDYFMSRQFSRVGAIYSGLG